MAHDRTEMRNIMEADNYIAKPFILRELLARVKTVLRRSQGQSSATTDPSSVTTFADWSFDKICCWLASRADEEVSLAIMEFNLLIAFTDNANKAFDRDQLLDMLQDGSWEAYDRCIDVLAGRLRGKIKTDQKKPALIKTASSTGYVFATSAELA